MDELLALQAEYVGWLEALPASLRVSTTADALEVITDLDLEARADIQPPKSNARNGHIITSERRSLDPGNSNQKRL